jgi:UDP-N-acetylmuramate--L-alanine ligase
MRKPDEIQSAFSDTDDLNGLSSFFLVGIGGAGMSAIARMLNHRGYAVTGTDSTASPETERLTLEGINVRIGHSPTGLEPGMALVVTDAIDLNQSPEVARAKELEIPIVRRSQALGWLLRDKKVIAVTGTHGKTTTTGMIGAGLQAAGMDPLIVVGASVPQFKGPIVEGDGEWAVVEACEAYDSFHDINPTIVVLTNLELDHVDFHGSYENLRDSVVRFVDKIPAEGWLVYCTEDRGASEVAELCSVRAIPYGLSEGWMRQSFNIMQRPMPTDRPMPSLEEELTLPGGHNKLNAAGAVIAAMLVGADSDTAALGISKFGGAERRLQFLQTEPIAVVDDYAHHPTEIQASLYALRQRFGDRRLIVVYQPHLYSRTEPLIKEFADALSVADFVVLTDIYPAREEPIPGVSSARIAELLSVPCRYVPSRHLLPREVAALAQPEDVIVGMGAGNISEFAPALIEELGRIKRNETKSYKIAVIYGGDSAEREVSLLSGRAVNDALKRQGHDSKLFDITELLLKSGDLSQFAGTNRPDVAFLAVHGSRAEDGGIQGLFELLHIPYTGSGIQSSAMAMDKALTKQILTSAGLPVAKGVIVTDSNAKIELEGPWIVKPNAQGSTVGLSFVQEQVDLKAAIEKALQYDTSAIVEEWVQGMEVSVPVLGDRALMPVEIAPTSGKYDFQSKYTPGATVEICPAQLSPAITEKLRDIALRSHRALNCRGATRTDMIVRDPDGTGEPVVLEVNTLPGMTSTSLLPNSAREAGIEFEALVQWLVEDALARQDQKEA